MCELMWKLFIGASDIRGSSTKRQFHQQINLIYYGKEQIMYGTKDNSCWKILCVPANDVLQEEVKI